MLREFFEREKHNKKKLDRGGESRKRFSNLDIPINIGSPRRLNLPYREWEIREYNTLMMDNLEDKFFSLLSCDVNSSSGDDCELNQWMRKCELLGGDKLG